MTPKATGFREEVINVKLAELLSSRGLLSIPESIISYKQTKRLPDITIGDYLGIRVVLEGKFSDKSGVTKILENDCEKRIEEGIAAIVMGILYPPNLRYYNWSTIEQDISNSNLKIIVITESEKLPWIDSNLEGLIEIIRRAYETLVSENIVNESVQLLDSTIDNVSKEFSKSPDSKKRLESILYAPKKFT